MSPLLPPTPSNTVGPYLAIGLRPLEQRGLVEPGTPGALSIEGHVLDGAGDGVPDGVVEIWQPGVGSENGHDQRSHGFGRCLTDVQGRFGFVTAKPDAVPLSDGSTQAPHLEVLIFARGLTRSLRTRLYFPGEPSNDNDPVLVAVPGDRRPTLIATATHDDATTLCFDIRLQGEGETVFFS